ncbi:unnamed protein product [Prorocentrum cordatum]|uniref:Uncharacterized protein n=1 Tax=Prorocentrum cordatum TaxID=2364126 RepID=A0ABN9Q2I3_9DINO|nr:unnamed protein product [Polarella glacialis]
MIEPRLYVVRRALGSQRDCLILGPPFGGYTLRASLPWLLVNLFTLFLSLPRIRTALAAPTWLLTLCPAHGAYLAGWQLGDDDEQASGVSPASTGDRAGRIDLQFQRCPEGPDAFLCGRATRRLARPPVSQALFSGISDAGWHGRLFP